jgi:hypothetical protein
MWNILLIFTHIVAASMLSFILGRFITSCDALYFTLLIGTLFYCLRLLKPLVTWLILYSKEEKAIFTVAPHAVYLRSSWVTDLGLA